MPGSAILFGSGYPLAYNQITVPPKVDVLMLAPRMAGETARQRFVEKRGFYAFVSVETDASGKGWKRLLGVAEGVGILRAGALELDAHQEAYLDLLVEQTVGAALGMAMMSAFSLGVESGLPPESLVLEMYMSEEMEMVFRSFREQGFFNASSVHGPTALFGGYLRTMELMGSNLTDIFQQHVRRDSQRRVRTEVRGRTASRLSATQNGRRAQQRRQPAGASGASPAGVAGRPAEPLVVQLGWERRGRGSPLLCEAHHGPFRRAPTDGWPGLRPLPRDPRNSTISLLRGPKSPAPATPHRSCWRQALADGLARFYG